MNSEIPKNRKVYNGANGDYLVVHEGLRNSPDIEEAIKRVIEVLENCLTSTRHLSDTGLILDFKSRELKTLAKECFDRHKTEQQRTLEQFDILNP